MTHIAEQITLRILYTKKKTLDTHNFNMAAIFQDCRHGIFLNVIHKSALVAKAHVLQHLFLNINTSWCFHTMELMGHVFRCLLWLRTYLICVCSSRNLERMEYQWYRLHPFAIDVCISLLYELKRLLSGLVLFNLFHVQQSGLSQTPNPALGALVRKVTITSMCKETELAWLILLFANKNEILLSLTESTVWNWLIWMN